jgi:ATP-dependent Clp protease ATP-binding subunit ClpC
MYERFTERARNVIRNAAQLEAERFNHEYIGTEHFLLGIVKEGTGVAASVLQNEEIKLRQVRLELERRLQTGPDTVYRGRLPQTPQAHKTIEYSMEEARNLKHNYVGTEHVLLGLLRVDDGLAAQVLTSLGLTLENARREVIRTLGLNEAGERWIGGRIAD